ncbi:hypothetical protein CFBP498_14850 [Xanthomonas hortorum pv. vitians]|uniref:Uncharacterized protein n=1 Tax=Xanthomonas hortorum pv. vitians TaxID=83224 RepID=A0A6V7CLV5_9XANT|nr:hypothetical protein CFBP498_14850 [Xanthomonas hortorum pv. vitians]CAD0318914.1 hypothetical protein CFBP498_14850 [Xanthomonas hortorum pv. vitians]
MGSIWKSFGPRQVLHSRCPVKYGHRIIGKKSLQAPWLQSLDVVPFHEVMKASYIQACITSLPD